MTKTAVTEHVRIASIFVFISSTRPKSLIYQIPRENNRSETDAHVHVDADVQGDNEKKGQNNQQIEYYGKLKFFSSSWRFHFVSTEQREKWTNQNHRKRNWENYVIDVVTHLVMLKWNFARQGRKGTHKSCHIFRIPSNRNAIKSIISQLVYLICFKKKKSNEAKAKISKSTPYKSKWSTTCVRFHQIVLTFRRSSFVVDPSVVFIIFSRLFSSLSSVNKSTVVLGRRKGVKSSRDQREMNKNELQLAISLLLMLAYRHRKWTITAAKEKQVKTREDGEKNESKKETFLVRRHVVETNSR